MRVCGGSFLCIYYVYILYIKWADNKTDYTNPSVGERIRLKKRIKDTLQFTRTQCIRIDIKIICRKNKSFY